MRKHCPESCLLLEKYSFLEKEKVLSSSSFQQFLSENEVNLLVILLIMWSCHLTAYFILFIVFTVC
jgi:hypothetical protein